MNNNMKFQKSLKMINIDLQEKKPRINEDDLVKLRIV